MDNAQDVTTAAPSQGQAPQSNEQAPMNSDVNASQTQTPVEGQSEKGEGLILGKFKSHEDLEKAYRELESHKTKVEMEKSELEKLFINQGTTELETPSKQVPESVTPETNPEQQIQEALMPLTKGVVNEVLTPYLKKLEIGEMINRYGDQFVSVAKQVADLQTKNPSLSMEAAYKIVSYDNLERTASNKAIQQVEKNIQQKQAALVENSQPSGYKATTPEEALANAKSSSEMAEVFEAMGPEYKKFAEISRERSRRRV